MIKKEVPYDLIKNNFERMKKKYDMRFASFVLKGQKHVLSGLLLVISFMGTAVCSDLNRNGDNASAIVSKQKYHDDSLSSEKRIIAHHMTKNNPYYFKRWYDLSRYGPEKPPRQQHPIYAYYHKNSRSLEEYIKWEIKAAKKMGLDGFEMFYPHNSSTLHTDMVNYDELIMAYLRVIEENDLDFKITLGLSHPKEHGSIDQLAEEISGRVQKYFDAVPHAKAWLKTPDGRFLWHSFGLESIFRYLDMPFYTENVETSYALVAELINNIEEKLDIEIAFVYHLRPVVTMKRHANRLNIDPKTYYRQNIHAIYDHFASISGFADIVYDESVAYWQEIKKISEERDKSYFQSIFLDFARGDDVIRYLPSKGSWHVQKLFEQAIDWDCDVIRLITWSDYPEGHHLQPGVNHNFGFGVLLNYYKNIWKGQPEKNDEDMGIVFTKKYDYRLTPSKHVSKVTYFEHIIPGEIYDSYLSQERNMNIVTLLTAPGTLYVNGSHVGMVSDGISSEYVPIEPGPVEIRVVRGNDTVVDFTTEEWLTDKPVRTDKITYSFSSEFKEYYHDIFGAFFDGTYYTSRDYNKKAK